MEWKKVSEPNDAVLLHAMHGLHILPLTLCYPIIYLVLSVPCHFVQGWDPDSFPPLMFVTHTHIYTSRGGTGKDVINETGVNRCKVGEDG